MARLYIRVGESLGKYCSVRTYMVRTGHDLWLLSLNFIDSDYEVMHTEHVIIGPSTVDELKRIGVPIHDDRRTD